MDLFIFSVKQFLAQAREEFEHKWTQPAQVSLVCPDFFLFDLVGMLARRAFLIVQLFGLCIKIVLARAKV